MLLSNFDLKAGLVEGERDAEGYFTKELAGGITERATGADFKASPCRCLYQHIRHFKIATDNNIRLGRE